MRNNPDGRRNFLTYRPKMDHKMYGFLYRFYDIPPTAIPQPDGQPTYFAPVDGEQRPHSWDFIERDIARGSNGVLRSTASQEVKFGRSYGVERVPQTTIVSPTILEEDQTGHPLGIGIKKHPSILEEHAEMMRNIIPRNTRGQSIAQIWTLKQSIGGYQPPSGWGNPTTGKIAQSFLIPEKRMTSPPKDGHK